MKFVIAAVLFAHGIGHVMGPLQVFKVAVVNPAWAGDSWLLTGAGGQTLGQAIGIVLWMTALVGFVAAAAVVMGWLPVTWWVPLAVASSVASLAAIGLDRRPARSARRWRPRRITRTRPPGEMGREVLWTGLILTGAAFAVLVLLPLMIALPGMPYR